MANSQTQNAIDNGTFTMSNKELLARDSKIDRAEIARRKANKTKTSTAKPSTASKTATKVAKKAVTKAVKVEVKVAKKQAVKVSKQVIKARKSFTNALKTEGLTAAYRAYKHIMAS